MRAALLLAAVISFVPAGATATASASPAKTSRVNFLANCGVSRMAPDDPIVYPGQPGRSHDHTFFGSRGISSHASIADLRAAGTTCGRKTETAAYWVPTLFRNGERVEPLKATAYYTLRQFTPVRPYPAGLKLVAGDADARAPQPLDIVWWSCGPFSGVRRSSSVPPRCTKKAGAVGARVVGRARPGHETRALLRLHVRFPDCWDGRRLDSFDHKAHVAYERRGRCPRSHPVRVPSLILIVLYPVRDGTGITLSSGGQFSGHADFINAWHQKELARIVRDCSRGRPRCAHR